MTPIHELVITTPSHYDHLAALTALWSLRGPIDYNVTIHHWYHPHAHLLPRNGRYGANVFEGMGGASHLPAQTAQQLRQALNTPCS